VKYDFKVLDYDTLEDFEKAVKQAKHKTQLANLNRDITKTQETTKDWETERLDIKATIDKRVIERVFEALTTGKGLFNTEGMESIGGDFKAADPIYNLISLGIIPTYAGNGGILTQIPALFTGDMEKIGDLDSDNVYINGMLNTQEDAIEGADNIMGEDKDKQIWLNPTHGLLGDLIESAIDAMGGTSGNKKQVERWKKEAKRRLNIHMHSQGNLIGGSDPDRRHNYYSYGAPINRGTVKERFGIKDDHIEMNRGDFVSNPRNILNPKTWSMPGHPTSNYGASKKH
jgi:hypothetical protein